MQLYPILKDGTVKGIFEWLKFVVRARSEDVQEFNNLSNVFISGRKVGKIPTSGADVVASDKIGDFNVNTTYAYFLVDNAGTGVWRRVAVGAF